MSKVTSPVRVPKYRHHRGVGQALVTINGRDIYLGKHGTPASREAYDRLIAEWLRGGRSVDPAPASISVNEVILAYVKFATGYYVKHGKQTDEVRMIKTVLSIVKRFYGRTAAANFGPLALKACRAEMIKVDWCRSHINKQADRVKRMFKWAAGEELVPGSVYEALRCVAGLKRGRTEAREGSKVTAVSDTDIHATLEKLPPVVRDMVQLQRFTGARPGEICTIRPCDINRGGDVWEYAPESHKTEHLNRDRVIFLGPKAQRILLPYLLRPADTYCFSPREAEGKRRAAAHDARKTPLSCGNRPGSNVRSRPKKRPRDRYEPNSYARAVRRAAQAAGVGTWSPNRLRHAFATDVRRSHGLEAVQVCLGHSAANVTQIYAERDFALAARVARSIG